MEWNKRNQCNSNEYVSMYMCKECVGSERIAIATTYIYEYGRHSISSSIITIIVNQCLCTLYQLIPVWMGCCFSFQLLTVSGNVFDLWSLSLTLDLIIINSLEVITFPDNMLTLFAESFQFLFIYILRLRNLMMKLVMMRCGAILRMDVELNTKHRHMNGLNWNKCQCQNPWNIKKVI